MKTQDNRTGIFLMLGAVFVFAAQDGVSRFLADKYSVLLIVMIRYWFFAAFVTVIASRNAGGIRPAAATGMPWLQIGRGVILVFEIWVTILAFVKLGLIATHALFASYPLMIAALSGPVLGEKVGPRRWAAIGAGFIGILVILQPGFAVFSPSALIALGAALLFAIYGLATRYVSRVDSAATSFFWTGISGVVVATLGGVFYWEPMAPADWIWMAALCVTGALGHYLLIRCYEVAEASAVQPFAYFQLVFVSIIAVSFFGETIELHVALGAAIVVGAGVFTVWRERQRARQDAKRVTSV